MTDTKYRPLEKLHISKIIFLFLIKIYVVGTSGLDKDLDQWVFHPLLFNLMSILLLNQNIKLQKMQSLVKRPNICLTYFKEKLLVLNTCCVYRKTTKIYE